jgi:hypothetical protein
MKIIVLITLLFAGFISTSHAQDYSKLDTIKLKDKSDFVKNENLIIECSNYLLNSPIKAIDSDRNHLKALQFIMRWMEGTPDYTFNIDETIAKATKSNPALLGIYMASMSKYVLENKDNSSDDNEVMYNSYLIFIKYCEDATKYVKQNKIIKELIKAKNDNTLKDYLKINIGQKIV